MDGPAGLGRDFIRCVLDQLEELTVTVPALGDSSFPVRVLRDEAWIDGVRLENGGGLIDNGLDHGGQFKRHRTPILER
ncbi:hypothetical protein ABZ669_20880 [Streptomyces hirsutus]